jgi:hypothetical protein
MLTPNSCAEKIKVLGEAFFSMPDEQYSDRINAFPRDEFKAFVSLANNLLGHRPAHINPLSGKRPGQKFQY